MPVTKTIVFGPYDRTATGLTATIVSEDGSTPLESGVTVSNAGTFRQTWKFNVGVELASTWTLYRYELFKNGVDAGGGTVWAKEVAGKYYADVPPRVSSDGSIFVILSDIISAIASYLFGSGSRVVDVLVKDESNANVANAIVTAFQNGVQIAVGKTGSDGKLLTKFNLNDGSYQIGIECEGFSHSTFDRTVSASATLNCTLTRLSIQTSDDDTTTTGYLVANVHGVPTAGIVFTLTPSNPPVASTGLSDDSAPWVETSDGAGLVQFVGMMRKGRYKLRRGDTGTEVDFTAGNGASFALPSVLGDTPNA